MAEARWSIHFAWGRPPYALDLPEVVIGRGDACTLQIADPEAAEEHARFIVDDEERVWLEDLGTGRPTLINGRALGARTELVDGDFVQIGHAVLTVRARLRKPTPVPPPPSDSQPHALPTIMMESPVGAPVQRVARETQATVEVDAADVLASIRRNQAPPDAPPAPAPATIAMAAVAEPGAPAAPAPPMVTLHGIGPNELAAAPTMIGELPPAPTRAGEISSAPTMIGAAPPRERSQSQADITPLPAPLPPRASISDLSSLVQQATASGGIGFGESRGDPTRSEKKAAVRSNVDTLPPNATLNSRTTQQLAQTEPRGVAYDKTAPPQEVPAEVTALHAQQTQIGARLPPEVSAATANTTQPAPVVTAADYAPPQRGPFGSFSRALDFVQQMFAMAKREPLLRKPILYNLVIATPIMLAISALLLVVRSGGAVYGLMCLGTALLYFIDYFMNAITAVLIHDYVTTGRADAATAKARARQAASGIIVFAAVSALLDVASTYARERRDPLSRILLGILRAIWTTATYVIMPAMVIEGVSFKDALSRSKRLMDHDPTGVGAGVVAMSLCTYLLGAIVFPLAFFVMRLGAHLHAIVGLVLFFAMVNVYWAVSGWLKISYSTLFYVWARQCEATGRPDTALAPLPLRHAIDAG